MANAIKIQIVGEDGYAAKVNSSGALEVDATLTPSGLQDVNLTQVAGASVATGHGTASGALRVELPTDGTGQVAISTLPSQAYSASATFTPAAASHTAGDVNGTAQQFSSIGPSGGRIMITTATIEIDGGTAEATAWRLYLFNVTPPSALADDDPFVLASGDRASYLGYVELGTAADIGDTQWNEFSNINKQLLLSSANLFGYLVNLSTLTPAAVAHIVTLHAIAV